MSVQNLANAPLIDTDLPTSQAYLNQALPSTAVAGADINRRYYPYQDVNAIMSMDNLPNSFGVTANQKGIIAAYLTSNFDSSHTLRVAMRKPTATLRDYRTGWDDLPALAVNIPVNSANATFSGGIAVSSQRQGQYAYVFRHVIQLGLFQSADSVTVFKVTRDEYVEVAGVAGGGQVGASPALPILSSENDGQYFVSDEEQPFVWNVYGGVQGGGVAYMTGFRDDSSQNIGYSVYVNPTTFYYGQTAAFYQQMQLPAGIYGYGPYLVHPWSSGSYDPPEAWYFVHEFDSTGQTTGRFKIYRAQWKKGAYIKPSVVTFGDDPNFQAGRTRYPALNPLGYAFEHNIFDDAHLVSIIGPFQEIPVYNPRGDLTAKTQNAVNTTTTKIPLAAPTALALGFNVVRDTKRPNVLHIVIADGGSYPKDSGVLNRIWFTNSSDDGVTWGRITQIGPAITPATQGTNLVGAVDGNVQRQGIPTRSGLVAAESVGYHDYLSQSSSTGIPPVVRTHDDVLLMGNLTRFTNYTFADGTSPVLHSYPDDFGAKISLAVVDYTGLGAATADRNSVIFVQHVQGGQISWQ